MKCLGVKGLGAYFRKMAINGYFINLFMLSGKSKTKGGADMNWRGALAFAAGGSKHFPKFQKAMRYIGWKHSVGSGV
jgi:hypothetical protein